VKVRIAVACLLAALGLASPAAAHESKQAPIIHSIDHLRWDTNALRRDSGLPPIETDFRYRAVEDVEYRLSVRRLWEQRFDTAWRESVWVRLAGCEAGGDWHVDADFDGGLQFHPGTWAAYRLPGFPQYAYQATPLEQVEVARRVRAEEGWRAWPACSAALGLR
jgi:hypothetical protein